LIGTSEVITITRNS